MLRDETQEAATPISEQAVRFLGFAFLFVLFTGIYETLRWLAGPNSGRIPLVHARDIISLERGMGLFIEPTLQHWIDGRPIIEKLTVWAYKYEHLAGSILFLVWLFFMRPKLFPFVWRWFWLSHVFALFGFFFYPLTPPRLVPELGLSDPTAADLANTPGWAAFEHIRNEYAAMPSLHCGYPLLFATVIWFSFPGSRLRWLAWLWPATMIFVVQATANHYWLDAVGGAFVVGLAALVVTKVFPSMPRPWSRNAAG
ncbi:MAG: phosphatase PAP2 family protein [Dehalococcoidia bacterium]